MGGRHQPEQGADSAAGLAQAVPIDHRQWIDNALTAVADPQLPAEDRAALYAVLYAIQRTIRRSLGIGVRSAATPQAELIAHLEANGLRDMGPVSVKATPFDVSWPVNDPDNWGDLGLQAELENMAKIAPEYIRHVPDHFELLPAALGEGVATGDPVAQSLHRHAKDRRWRIEGGRRLSLVVKESAP